MITPGAATIYPAYYPPAYGVAFPGSPLDVGIELDLGGWANVTSDTYQRAGTTPPITITRGRQNETASANPSAAVMSWNNRSGQFSPRNPTGPWYGLLGRNTPLRVSVPGAGTAYRAEDDQVSYCSTAGLNITGSIDIRIDLQPSGYYPAILCTQAASSAGWVLFLNDDGTLSFVWWSTSSTILAAQSTQPIPYLGRIMIRVTFSASTGDVEFFTAADMSATQTQLGQTVATGGTGVYYTAGIPLRCGGPGDGGAPFANTSVTGLVYEMQVWDGIGGSGGTLEADPQFYNQAPGVTSFTDPQGNVWTLAGSSAIDDRNYRGYFECSSLPQQWDPTGTDVWTPVSASGVLRRLQQNNAPLMSAFRRAVTSLAADGGLYAPAAYWPCEDPQGSGNIASGLPGGAPMNFSTAPAFQGQAGSPSADQNFPCSAQLPQVGSTAWDGPVISPPGFTWTDNVTRFLLYETAGTIPTGTVLCRVFTGGTVDHYDLIYYTGGLGMAGYNRQGTELFGVGGVAGFNIDGNPSRVSADLVDAGGGNLTWQIQVVHPGVVLGGSYSGTYAAAVGPVLRVIINPAAVNLGATEIGQVSVQGKWSSLDEQYQPLNAWNGEPAGMRFARICTENSINSRVYGFPADSMPMGYQPIDTLANLLQYCEVTDRGMMYEPATCLGLGYRTLASLCNQTAAVSLDYAAAELGGDGSQGLVPEDDDQFTVNDCVVSRNNGTSAQVQVTTGPMSIQPPPAGVGDYATQLTTYNDSDGQNANIASWVTWVGTCDEERYPVIPLNLARPELAGLIDDIIAADLGSHIQITSPPAWLPPGTIDQLVYGVTEKLGGLWWLLSWNTVPELPYEVAVAGASNTAGVAHADTAGSQLPQAYSASATSLLVCTAAGNQWTTASSDFPFDIGVAGERMTVTGISNATGSVTSPAAGAVLASLSVPAGTYDLVMWQVTLSGTLSSNDADNFALYNGGTLVAASVNPAQAGTYVQAAVTVGVGTGGLKILAGTNSPTSGSTYAAAILSPQTFSVTRSVNGVSKAQAAGAAVSLYSVPVAALAGVS